MKMITGDHQDSVNGRPDKSLHAISIMIDWIELLSRPKQSLQFAFPNNYALGPHLHVSAVTHQLYATRTGMARPPGPVSVYHKGQPDRLDVNAACPYPTTTMTESN
jgi:hypothetical protein